jgi:lysozyme family protein
MSDFNRAIQLLLKDEGGYSSEDNGRGAVNYGITQATLTAFWKTEPSLCQSLELPRRVEDLKPEHGPRFYRAFFWDRLSLGVLEDDQLAGLLFGLAVNQGPGWALRHARKALAAAGVQPAKDTTGIMLALNGISPREAIVGIYTPALERYHELAAKNPALYGDDVKGWELRLRKLCGIE